MVATWATLDDNARLNSLETPQLMERESTLMKKGQFLALFAALSLAIASGSAMASSDGEKVFKKRCKACHSSEAGKNKVGPYLAGVFGRKAGTATGFKRYKGLKGVDVTWDEALLNEWLTNPKVFVKKRGKKSTSMTFKLKKEGDRKAIIEYLKTL